MGDIYYVFYIIAFSMLMNSLLAEIDDCPSKCDCLELYVDCSKKNLQSITNLPQWVEKLDLNYNRFNENLTKSLENLTNLKELKLNKNHLRVIPDFTALKELKELSLSANEIEYIDCNHFPMNSSLRTLHLNKNHIKSIADGALNNLTNLLNLKLNENLISSLPNHLFKFQSKLRSLELNHNKLQMIEGLLFQGLEHLTTLKLKYNYIYNIMDGAFFGLKSVSLLNLDHNRISNISKGWMYGLESLSFLSISNNIISKIDTGCWEITQNLNELDLSHNNLREIESRTFQHLNYLKKLNLSGNKIASISQDSFSHTPQLQTLHLNNNKISWTVEDMNGPFSRLQNLQRFSLASNHIKSINAKAFDGLSNLIDLDLRGNNITSIQQHAFETLTKLKKLHMNATSLLCDCNLQWLSKWIKEKVENKFVSASCAYPEELRGVLITKLKDSDCGDSPKPKIVENPKAQLAIKGHNASLVCGATSSPFSNMTFLWRKNNINISEPTVQENVTVTDRKQRRANSVLVIQNISHSDSGKYQCVVSNNFGTTYSSKAKINIATFPKFTQIPNNVTVKNGETVSLNCAATGDPFPEISWKKDGGIDFPAARERRMSVIPDDHVFFIVSVKAVDMGIYSCAAKNDAGTILANATLTVLEPPSFIGTMENKEVASGKSVVLQCMVSGSPKPLLKWSKDGKPVIPSERHFFTGENQLLIILGVTSSDAGHYECEIKNSLGTKRDMTELRVLPPVAIMVNEEDMTGIIIITVVCCAVGTSIVWVVIIYHTRRRMASAVTKYPTENIKMTSQIVDSDSPHMFSDTASERSSCKDSGTGDSAKQTSFDGVPSDRNDQLHFDAEVVSRSYSPLPEAHKLLPSSFKPSMQVCVNTSITPATYSFSSHSDKDYTPNYFGGSQQPQQGFGGQPGQPGYGVQPGQPGYGGHLGQTGYAVPPGGYGGQPAGLEVGHGPYPSLGPGGTVSPQVTQWFRAVDKDQSGFITAPELKAALVNAQGRNFSETACRLMIGMFDKDRSGHINLEEFDKLYTYINQWLAVFKTYDTDQSGQIDHQELTKALQQMGFQFSPNFIEFVTKRSDQNEGKVSVDEFIVLCVQIQRFTEAFRIRDTQQKGVITIGFEDFLNVALSCNI